MPTPLVSVLIVNYNGGRHVGRCLSALAQQSYPRHRFEVVVVDNASQDDSAKEIQRDFPWVQLILSKKNLGFAEGNNLAHRSARGGLCVLLNNDAIPDPHWLEELLNARTVNPGAILASKLVFDSDVNRINSGGLCLLRDGRGADAGFRHADRGQYEEHTDIFGGCGAAVLLPTKPGQDIFPKHFFAYSEDLDSAWAHRSNGGKAQRVSRALVRHVHGAAGGEKSPFVKYLVERNRVLTAIRNGDAFLALAALGILYLKLLSSVFDPRKWKQAPPLVKAFLGVLWFLPQELFVRYERRCRIQQRRSPCESS